MNGKRIRKRILLAAGVLLVIIVVVLIMQYGQLFLVSNELNGEGSYELEVQYCLSDVNADDIGGLILETVLGQMSVTAKVVKNADLYRIRLFQADDTIPFLELYRSGEEVLINAGNTANWLLQSAKEETEAEWIKGVSEIGDFYVSTDTLREWLGTAEVGDTAWITQFIEFPPQGFPVLCQAPEGRKLSLEYQLIESYFRYETADNTEIIVSAYALPFSGEERQIYERVKQEDGTVYEILAKYTETDMALTMPEKTISAAESLFLKKLFQKLLQ